MKNHEQEHINNILNSENVVRIVKSFNTTGEEISTSLDKIADALELVAEAIQGFSVTDYTRKDTSD